MKKTIKVSFTFDDGSTKFLEGEEAEKWSRWNGNICQFAHLHGVNPDWTALDWKYLIEDFNAYNFSNSPKDSFDDE